MRSSVKTLLIIAGGYILISNALPFIAGSDLPPGRLTMVETPRDIPSSEFLDARGERVDLGDFKGSYLLVNVWATWCEPCREEMPALDQLARDLGDRNIRVMPVSIDLNGAVSVEGFYERHNLNDLPVYVDPSQNIMQSLNVFGIPTTVLIDPAGREIGRMVGPAQWDSQETLDQLSGILES